MNEMVRVVKPNEEGFCPILMPGQCCLDQINGCWHFCTPDNEHFAVGPNTDSKVRVKFVGGEVVRFDPHPPTFVSKKHIVGENEWSIRDGTWIRN